MLAELWKYGLRNLNIKIWHPMFIELKYMETWNPELTCGHLGTRISRTEIWNRELNKHNNLDS